MRVCIPLRDPAPANLKLGNLRSEGRWERAALEALSVCPDVTDLYTLGYGWEGGGGICGKYRGVLNSQHSAKDVVLLMHDWNVNSATAFDYKGIVTNIFAGPWAEQRNEIRFLHSKYSGRFVFTMSYPYFYNDGSSKGHLISFIPEKDVLLLPSPGIPHNAFGDRFDNKMLLWAWRLIFMSALSDFSGPHGPTAAPIFWALSKLQEDSSLKLFILTGWEKHEVKDYIADSVVYVKENINDYFWSMPSFLPYVNVRNQVAVEYSLSWESVLDKFKESKLLINFNKGFGGPPLEASMHGVPYVGCGKSGVLVECPEYLYTSSASGATEMLDRLFFDRDFYTKTAVGYNKYACDNFSYASFCNNLRKLITDRGME